MSKTKTLTASEQSALLRYASALPKGHETRRAIVAAVKVAASGGWAAVFEALDGDFKSYNAKTVTDWNKVYKRMRKEGVKDAGAAAHFYHEYRAGHMDAEGAASALTQEGVKPPTGYEGASKTAASQGTWGRRLNELKQEYMGEVVREAIEIIKSEGGKAAGGATGVVGNLKGMSADGQPVQLTLQWGDGWSAIESTMYLGGDKRKGKHVVLSMSPSQVAAEALYAHFQGLLP